MKLKTILVSRLISNCVPRRLAHSVQGASPAKDYDAVVIGGGHNGLVTVSLLLICDPLIVQECKANFLECARM
jgi:hypothetical protein